MKLTKYFMPFAALALLASCTDDKINGPTENVVDDSNDGIYMTLEIQPLSTRTETEKTGEEIGSDSENMINNAWVIFASHGQNESEYDNKYITYAEFDRFMPTTSNTRYVARGKEAKKDLLDAIGNNNYITVDVYVITNPGNAIKNKIKSLTSGVSPLNELTLSWTDGSDDERWSKTNSFLMTNGTKTDMHTNITINKADIENDKYNSYENALPLGRVGVQRVVARFDYDTQSHLKEGKQIYSITQGEDNTEIELVEMALINQNREFYMFKQVGNSKVTNEGAENQDIEEPVFEFFGEEYGYADQYEKSYNFVKDPWANEKSALKRKGEVRTFFGYTIPWKKVYNPETNKEVNAFDLTQENDLKWTKFSALTGLTNTEGITNPKTDPGKEFGSSADNTTGTDYNRSWSDYRVWRYVLPNSIYNTDDLAAYKTPLDGMFGSQKHINSTGVVFKAKINKINDNDLSKLNGKDIYVFNGVLYGTLEQLKTKYENYQTTLANNGKLPDEQAQAFYYSVGLALEEYMKEHNITLAQNGHDYEYLDDRYLADTEEDGSVTKLGVNSRLVSYAFTIYSAEEEDNNYNYYCYYYYWNRHNDNGVSNVMGPMEFAVVSNNVYKLSVTTIKHLGHPADPSNDPDPVNPDDPDEEDSIDTYFVVAVDVLPWTLRVNDIEF